MRVVSTGAGKVQAACYRVRIVYIKLLGYLRAGVRILTFWTRLINNGQEWVLTD